MGGDHKCPLCSATFTRPQHVGRHLRAHTGDRPYECKQCPLKFARSDLLSRHVNKAHPKPPDEAAEEAAAKANGDKKASNAKGKKKADEARPSQPQQSVSARSSLDLSGGNPSTTNGIIHLPPYGYPPGFNPSTSQQPYGIQMQISQSDSGVHPALVRPPAYANEHLVAAMQHQQQQMPFKQEKARACDQCNHSKVKCDSGRPCAKCIHRSMACTYDKPSKNRSANQQQHPPTQSARVEPDRRRNSFAAPEHTSNFHPHLQQQQQPQGYYPSPPGMYNPSPPYVNYNQTFTPSPQTQHLAPTPSLTHTTSPAGSDEYLESHRGSVPNFIPTLGPSQEGMQWTASPEDLKQTSTYPPLALDASPQFSQHYSPSYLASLPPNMLQNGTAMDPVNLYQWPPGTQMPVFDPRYQVQNAPVFASDDEDSSLAASNSTNSSFIDLTDLNKVQPAQARPPRRLSTGVWQNAFDQMSLQDRLNADMGAVQEHPPDAGYLAMRPTFPTYTLSNGEGEQRMPSLSDTKDLWKMFMTDPNAAQPLNDDPNQTSTLTPRPGMGKRTLSKSNSMPDLNSPVANSALFSSFLNGNTPRAGAGAGQPPPEGAADPATVRKWSQELQARQGNFKMQMDTVPRKSSSPQTTSPGVGKKPAMGTWQAMPPPERPLASVRQGASLQQTLAPERTPSFNLTPQAWSDASNSFNSGPFPHTPQSHHRVQSMSSTSLTPTKHAYSLSGVPPAFARPGNKRLPSQTLMPDTQKRASFSVFDDEDGGPLPDSDYAAVAHDKVARHHAVGAAGHGQYAPSYMSQSPHQVSLNNNNNNTISSSPSYSSPLSSYSPQTSSLQQPALVNAPQTWSTWPPLTAGQPQLAGLDDLRKGL